MSVTDQTVLALYAAAYERYIEAQDGINRYGLVVEVGDKGYQQKTPYVTIAADAAKEMKGYMAELGLTPAARSKLDITPPEPENEFTQFARAA